MKSPHPPFKLEGRDREMVKEWSIEEGDSRKGFDRWLRYKILNDLYFFGTEFLGWRDSSNKSRTRWRVDPELHRWLCDILCKPGDKLIKIPRFHLKSTWGRLRIVQLILANPNVRILLGSATARIAEKNLAWIKRILAHPKLRTLFKEQLPAPGKKFAKWQKSTQHELTVWRDQNQEFVPDDPQVLAVGVGAEITGTHCDYAFLDDLVTDDNVRTVGQLEYISDWWEYLQPIIEADAEILIIGTPYHYRDLYARIYERKEIPRKAIYTRKNIENGKVIYGSWWTEKDYERLKSRMSPYKYSCQLECNAVPDEDRIFPPPQPTFDMPLPADAKGYRYYCLIDPAATTQEYSDASGVVIIAVNHLNQVWVVDSRSFKIKGDELAEQLIAWQIRYGFKKVGIELGLQSHLQTIIDMKLAEYNARHPVAVRIHVHPVPIKKLDKGHRIDTMIGSLVRSGKILVNTNLTRLIGQMDNFTGKPGDDDNEIDALSMCPYVIETFAAHQNLSRVDRGPGMFYEDFYPKKTKGWGSRFREAV